MCKVRAGLDAAVALNQLLASDDASVAATEQTLQQLRARVQHLSELLAESESTVLQLTAQEKVLKDEIRRLDSLQGVNDMNAEYAKNVLFKFFESSEREVGVGRERNGESDTTNAVAMDARLRLPSGRRWCPWSRRCCTSMLTK